MIHLLPAPCLYLETWGGECVARPAYSKYLHFLIADRNGLALWPVKLHDNGEVG